MTDYKLPPVTRPNGKVYRPRKLETFPLGDEDGEIWTINVMGTHDRQFAVLHARAKADELSAGIAPDRYELRDAGEATWLRAVPTADDEGQLRHVYQEDSAKGRACVSFDVEVIWA